MSRNDPRATHTVAILESLRYGGRTGHDIAKALRSRGDASAAHSPTGRLVTLRQRGWVDHTPRAVDAGPVVWRLTTTGRRWLRDREVAALVHLEACTCEPPLAWP